MKTSINSKLFFLTYGRFLHTRSHMVLMHGLAMHMYMYMDMYSITIMYVWKLHHIS